MYVEVSFYIVANRNAIFELENQTGDSRDRAIQRTVRNTMRNVKIIDKNMITSMKNVNICICSLARVRYYLSRGTDRIE